MISGITAKSNCTLNNSLPETRNFYRFANFKRQYRLLQLGWFYFANQESKTLHLGPYVGADRSYCHPFGKGICGQVAVSNENFVVPDVAAQDNYIACSFTVKSEIVVPLL
jgi:GAF domain-containing protein